MDANMSHLGTCSNNGLIVFDTNTGNSVINMQPHGGNINSLLESQWQAI